MKKNIRGTPVPGGRCASTNKTGSFSSACKNFRVQHPLGAKVWSSEKGTLAGYDLTFRCPLLMDESSLNFLYRT